LGRGRVVKYALAIFPEEPRCLVSISRNLISFNISGYMTFNKCQQAEEFKGRWAGHFFDVKKLVIVEIDEK
jgi:hypothetical protein